MRIISGTLGSRTLLTVEGEGYRPAMAKVRESLFSILSARLTWDGLRVLDLFAGSGSLAFEAVSRGAASAHLVELDDKACRCIRQNISRLGLQDKAFLVKENVPRLLRRVKGADRSLAGPFDLVFLDPPYRKNFTQNCLDALVQCNWLAEGAYVSIEVEENLKLTLPKGLEKVTEREFGQTTILIVRFSSSL